MISQEIFTWFDSSILRSDTHHKSRFSHVIIFYAIMEDN